MDDRQTRSPRSPTRRQDQPLHLQQQRLPGLPDQRAGENTVLCYDERQVDTADTLRHWSVLSRRIMPLGVAAASTCTTTLPQFAWTYAADTRGNIVKITDPREPHRDRRRLHHEVHLRRGGHQPRRSRADEDDADGCVFNYGLYHASGQPEKIVDFVGDHHAFGYDADSRTQWMQDAVHQGDDPATDVRAFRTYYDFDEFGRVVRQSAPKSTSTDRGQPSCGA